MTHATCGTMMPDFGPGPHDHNGCHLALGHNGPHECVATNGRTYEWETDLYCDCESCREAEKYGDHDYCIIYSEKRP
jgi:hypothetical protein